MSNTSKREIRAAMYQLRETMIKDLREHGTITDNTGDQIAALHLPTADVTPFIIGCTSRIATGKEKDRIKVKGVNAFVAVHESPLCNNIEARAEKVAESKTLTVSEQLERAKAVLDDLQNTRAAKQAELDATDDKTLIITLSVELDALNKRIKGQHTKIDKLVKAVKKEEQKGA